MVNIQNIDKRLLRSSITKNNDYFVLNLKLLTSECGLFTIENLGDEIKFTCSSSPPRKLSISGEDIVVSVPYGKYESFQLRKLAHIIELLSTLDELKYFRFYEFFDNNIEHSINCKEYFLLETNEKSNLNTGKDDEFNLLDRLNENIKSEFELNELLKPIIHGAVKKKIDTMHGLLNHFTKNTKILIEQTMDEFDKKSSNINSNMQIIQNRILFQEAKISRLNDFAWKILKQIGEEQVDLSLSESESVYDEKDNTNIGHKVNKEVLTLKEAMEIRKSHGCLGLPEDFESPDKLVHFDSKKICNQNNTLEKFYGVKKNTGIETNSLKHFHLSKIEFDQMKVLHPATTQMIKMKFGVNSENTKNIDKKSENNVCTRIYDPILEYKNKNTRVGERTMKGFTPTVFSYLGRPIPTLNHKELPYIPKQKIIESIQHSMNTEVSKNEKWRKIGRPVEKKEMKEKTPEILQVKPKRYEIGEFSYSINDVYNVLL
ncbi:hypothetical protein FG386_003176 [Cryptosporidium ryanae]|uniref:uncharacterized protein n=1 Tax=Cryptosporidium ryanae TaxID=515981 RepID=UPI00351AB05A|nr:hypothetical protein FG386_003176 [Cryptosporidium ryanae]